MKTDLGGAVRCRCGVTGDIDLSSHCGADFAQMMRPLGASLPKNKSKDVVMQSLFYH